MYYSYLTHSFEYLGSYRGNIFHPPTIIHPYERNSCGQIRIFFSFPFTWDSCLFCALFIIISFPIPPPSPREFHKFFCISVKIVFGGRFHPPLCKRGLNIYICWIYVQYHIAAWNIVKCQITIKAIIHQNMFKRRKKYLVAENYMYCIEWRVRDYC